MNDYRFGTFELDVQSGELRRQGRLLRLPGQPFQILVALLERPGTIVTREELRQRLWGTETFVEFDHSLNTAIKRLREALSDTASTPRFIETVPRRGYRFIAPVEPVPTAVRSVEEGLSSDRPNDATPTATARPAISSATESFAASDGARPAAGAGDAAVASVERRPTGRDGVMSTTPSFAASAVARATAVASDAAPRRGRLLIAGGLVVVVVIAVFAIWVVPARWRSAGGAGLGEPRLAVLSFQNLTGDPGRGYVAEGFTEELVSQLGRLAPGRLGVIAHSSSASFEAAAPLAEVVGALGVDYVIQGSVRDAGDRYRIAVRLVRARDLATVWSELYEGRLLDLVGMQRDVGQQVARQLALTLLPQDQGALARATTGDSAAYEAYLRGLAELSRGPGEGFVRAVDLFQRAIAADPHYALAYAALAESYILRLDYYIIAPDEAQPAAMRAARQALAIDDGLAEAHCALADVLSRSGERAAADQEFARAISLNPSRAATQLRYASHLNRSGRRLDAREQLDRARLLAPRSADILTELAYTEMDAGHLDAASLLATDALRYQPEYPFALYTLGHVALRRATPQNAIAIASFERARVSSGHAPKFVAALGSAYLAAARPDDAAQALAELRTLARSRYVPPGMIDDLANRLHQ